MMPHGAHSQAAAHINTSCTASTALTRLHGLHDYRSPQGHAQDESTRMQTKIHACYLDPKANNPCKTEYKQPLQSLRTLAWFTAAPVATRTLTTSTWPFRQAAYNGVVPSVCHTPDTRTLSTMAAHSTSHTHQHVLLNMNSLCACDSICCMACS
jgi:hypothetical protein